MRQTHFMRWIAILVGILMIPPAFSGEDPLFEDAVMRVSADLAERVITLDESVYVYHWTRATELSDKDNNQEYDHQAFPPEETQARVMKRLKQISKWFWDSMEKFSPEYTPYGLVGGGLYAARDPISSNGYGPILISIRLDAGARLLDLRSIAPGTQDHDYRSGNKLYIHESTQAALAKVGCIAPTIAHIRDHWLNQESCAKILNVVFRDLGIIGNTHSWYGGNIAGCSPRPDGFAIYDFAYMNDQDRIHTFYEEKISTPEFAQLANETEEKTLWHSILSFYKANALEGYAEGWPGKLEQNFRLTQKDPALSAIPETFNLTDWNSKHLFHCDENSPGDKTIQPPWAVEPPPPPKKLPTPYSVSNRISELNRQGYSVREISRFLQVPKSLVREKLGIGWNPFGRRYE